MTESGMEARMPPQAIEEEMAVLGSIFLDRKAFFEAQEVLTEESFYKPAHQKIYRAMMNIDSRGESAIDYLTVSEELEKMGCLEEIGGAYYLTELSNYVPSASNAKQYIEIVSGKDVLRRVIEIGSEVVQTAFDGNVEPKEVLELAQHKFLALNINGSKRIAMWNDILQRSLETLSKFHEQKAGIVGIPTGISKLDEKLGGLKNGDLIIIAARPGSGKTAFTINNIALHAAQRKTPIGIFSLEMSDESLAMRSIAAEAKVDHFRMSHGLLGDSEWEKVAKAMGKLYDIPIYIDDTPGMNVVQIRAKARQLKLEYDVGVILIDYIQLMPSHKRGENRNLELGFISQSLKAMAKELKVPVIVLSQLSRECEKRSNKRPILSDLRDSGSLEQDTDVVLFIFRPEIFGEKSKKYDMKGNTLFIIAKHRNGETGAVETNFLKNQMLFANLDTVHEEEDVRWKIDEMEGQPF